MGLRESLEESLGLSTNIVDSPMDYRPLRRQSRFGVTVQSASSSLSENDDEAERLTRRKELEESLISTSSNERRSLTHESKPSNNRFDLDAFELDLSSLSQSKRTSDKMSNLSTTLQQPKQSDTKGSSISSEKDSDFEVVENPVEMTESEIFDEEEEDINNEVKEEKKIEEVKKESQSEKMEVVQSPIK